MENNEMMDVFCANLTKELTSKVNGFIFVRVLDDSDDVQVSIEYRGFKFKYVFEGAVEYIRYGGDTVSVARMIMDKYRSFIVNRFFFKSNKRNTKYESKINVALGNGETVQYDVPCMTEEEEESDES